MIGRVQAIVVVLAVASGGVAPTSAQEEEAVVPRGTAGLVRVAFEADNQGTEPMSCGIAAAHWYSIDLGTARTGQAIRHDLWASPATGEIFDLNDKQDRMPVQSLWCGFAGRSWATRFMVPIERRGGSVPSPIALACFGSGGRLSCR